MDVLNLFRWGYDKYEKRKEQETQDKINRKVIKCIAGIAATGLCLAVFLFWKRRDNTNKLLAGLNKLRASLPKPGKATEAQRRKLEQKLRDVKQRANGIYYTSINDQMPEVTHCQQAIGKMLTHEKKPVNLAKQLQVSAGVPRVTQTVSVSVSDQINNTFKSNRRVALRGLAGSGKSTVLANYLETHGYKYAAVFLTNAESVRELIASFKMIAGKLKQQDLSWEKLLKNHTPCEAAKFLLNHVCEYYAPRLVLVAHENVPAKPADDWLRVMEWTAETVHTLLSSRHAVKLSSHGVKLPTSIALPDGVGENEFPEVVGKLVSTYHVEKLSEDELKRLRTLTKGLPEAIAIVIGQIHETEILDSRPKLEKKSADKVLRWYENNTGKAKLNNIFNTTIARLDRPMRETLLCLAQFDPDNLPKLLVEKAIAEVVKDPDAVLSQLVHSFLLRACETSPSEGNVTSYTMHRLLQTAARNWKEQDRVTSLLRAVRAIRNAWADSYNFYNIPTWAMADQLLSHLQRCTRMVDKMDKTTITLPPKQGGSKKILPPWSKVRLILARNLTEMGLFLVQTKDYYDEASEYLEKALKIYRETPGYCDTRGENHQDTARALHYLGFLHYLQGGAFGKHFHMEAKEQLMQALQMYRAIPGYRDDEGESHRDTADVHLDLAYLFNMLEDTVKAKMHCTAALDILHATLGKKDPLTGDAYQIRGCLKGNFEDFKTSLEIYNNIESVSKQHPEIGNTYARMGELYFSLDDPDNSIKSSARALTIYKNVLGTHSLTACGHAALGYTYLYKKKSTKEDHTEGLKHLRKAHEIYAKVLGKDHVDTKSIWSDIRDYDSIH